jgi:hypothetical protein
MLWELISDQFWSSSVCEGQRAITKLERSKGQFAWLSATTKAETTKIIWVEVFNTQLMKAKNKLGELSIHQNKRNAGELTQKENKLPWVLSTNRDLKYV